MIVTSPTEAQRLVLRSSGRAYFVRLFFGVGAFVVLGLRASIGIRAFLALCAGLVIVYRLVVWPRSLTLDETGFRVDWRLPVLHPKVVRWDDVELLEAKTAPAGGVIPSGIRYRVRGKGPRTFIACFVPPESSRVLSASELFALMSALRGTSSS